MDVLLGLGHHVVGGGSEGVGRVSLRATSTLSKWTTGRSTARWRRARGVRTLDGFDLYAAMTRST